jgi:hypothetical protein
LAGYMRDQQVVPGRACKSIGAQVLAASVEQTPCTILMLHDVVVPSVQASGGEEAPSCQNTGASPLNAAILFFFTPEYWAARGLSAMCQCTRSVSDEL